MIKEPNTLTAMEAAASISSGSLSSVDLVQSCLDQISKTDDQIKAWEYIDVSSVYSDINYYQFQHDQPK